MLQMLGKQKLQECCRYPTKWSVLAPKCFKYHGVCVCRLRPSTSIVSIFHCWINLGHHGTLLLDIAWNCISGIVRRSWPYTTPPSHSFLSFCLRFALKTRLGRLGILFLFQGVKHHCAVVK
jgi:hypothetical protein